MNIKNSIWIMIFSGTAALAGTLSTGPTSNYYLTDGSTMYQVKGLTLINSFAATGLPAAIDTTIRMAGEFAGGVGAQYSLGGTASGTTYTNPTNDYLWDGTTDTTHNYTMTSGAASIVLQTDLDWTNPVVLFTLGSGYDSLGITFDSKTNTLWTSNWNGGTTVSNYTLGGTLLSSFDAGFSQIGGLAYDSADDTLWMTQYGNSALFQFNKSGTLLQEGTISGLTAATLWSGEIVEQAPAAAASGAPEPGSMLLFGGGALLLALRRRR